MAGKFEITGGKEMAAKIQAIAKRFPGQLGNALHVEGEEIMTTSKAEHVPVDLGTLRASGEVDPPKFAGRDVSVRLAFGGAAAPYALAVHEHDSVHSPPTWRGKAITFSPPGRGPKYLERPMMDAVRGMPERIGKRLEEDLGE